MSDVVTTPGIPAISLTPTTDEAARVAECIGLLLAGRPLPPDLRPPAAPAAAPPSVEDGLQSILHGAF